MKEKPPLNIQLLISVGMFVISMSGAIGGYYKSIYDIRKEINEEGKEIREEIKANYATKEETKFIQSAILEMKADIKDIKRVILSREIHSLEQDFKKKIENSYGKNAWAKKGQEVIHVIRVYGVSLEKAWAIVNGIELPPES